MEAALALGDTVMVAAAIAAPAVLGRVAGRDTVPGLEAHHIAVEGGSSKEAATVHTEPEKAVGHREPVLLEAADRSGPAVADPEGVAGIGLAGLEEVVDIDPVGPVEAVDIGLADPVEDIVAEMDPSSKTDLVAGPAEDTIAAGSRKDRADSAAVPGAHNRRAAERDSPVAADPAAAGLEAPANREVVQT